MTSLVSSTNYHALRNMIIFSLILTGLPDLHYPGSTQAIFRSEGGFPYIFYHHHVAADAMQGLQQSKQHSSDNKRLQLQQEGLHN